MYSIKSWLTIGMSFLLLLSGSGCGSGNVDVYPVKGKVLFDGQPMIGGGSISFVPLGNKPGKAAGGEIAEDGSFTLTTYKEGDGCMLGEFRVIIHQVVEREPERTEDGQRAKKASLTVAPKDQIPAACSSVNSPLKATVEKKDNNEITINISRNIAAPQS
jgi:hypothetical protein